MKVSLVWFIVNKLCVTFAFYSHKVLIIQQDLFLIKFFFGYLYLFCGWVGAHAMLCVEVRIAGIGFLFYRVSPWDQAWIFSFGSKCLYLSRLSSPSSISPHYLVVPSYMNLNASQFTQFHILSSIDKERPSCLHMLIKVYVTAYINCVVLTCPGSEVRAERCLEAER